MLTGFFAAMLAVFYQTLEVDKPKWTLDSGLIGSNPGKLRLKWCDLACKIKSNA